MLLKVVNSPICPFLYMGVHVRQSYNRLALTWKTWDTEDRQGNEMYFKETQSRSSKCKGGENAAPHN